MELKKKFKVLGFVETVQKHLFDFFVFLRSKWILIKINY